MKRIVFWFDPISPYAYLAFHRLPEVLQGCSYVVAYRPVLFAGLLRHWGQKGPAEIAPKRAFTYRQVSWTAQTHGIELHLPDPHPFNPLGLLRLALACAPAGGLPNRRVVEAVFAQAWASGGNVVDAEAIARLIAQLEPVRDPAGDDVKRELHAHTDAAIAEGVFGVPMLVCDGKAFWGLDGLPMLASFLRGDAWFDGAGWSAADGRAPGIERRG